MHEFRKIMTRQLSLASCECWDNSERLQMPHQYKNLLYFDPLFKYVPGKAVDVFYNFTDPAQDLRPLLNFLNENIDWFSEKKRLFDALCGEFRALMASGSQDHARMFNLMCEIWPTISVANTYGSTQFVSVPPSVLDICIQIRDESDDVLHPFLTYLDGLIGNRFVTYSEFANNAIPSDEILRQRAQGFVYHKGSVYLNADEYARPAEVLLVDPASAVEQKNVLTGNVACRGVVRGRVVVVFELSDLKNVQEGDILVTPMTTPDMMTAIHKAAAIVTDEGGITSHAAIVARELNKPCVIGTKLATTLLRDGMVVEVDADNGVVHY